MYVNGTFTVHLNEAKAYVKKTVVWHSCLNKEKLMKTITLEFVFAQCDSTLTPVTITTAGLQLYIHTHIHTAIRIGIYIHPQHQHMM